MVRCEKKVQPQELVGHIEEQALSDQQNVLAGSSVTTWANSTLQASKHLSDQRQIVNVDSGGARILRVSPRRDARAFLKTDLATLRAEMLDD